MSNCTPERLEELADLADPEKLWQCGIFSRENFNEQDKARLDTGIALRRYADYIRQLEIAYANKKSYVVTPISGPYNISTGFKKPPKEHAKRRDHDGG